MEEEPVVEALPHIYTKESQHPIAQILLGTVYAAHWMNDLLVLYYQDGHKAALRVDEDGEIAVADLAITSC